MSETKIQLSLFQDNVPNFTNAIRAPICHLLKANQTPSFQHFLTIFHGCLDAINDEFHLELLDKLDAEYNHINNLRRWVNKEDPQILALTATISNLQSQLSHLKGQYGTLQSYTAKTKVPTPPTPETMTKLQKHHRSKLMILIL